MKRPSTARRSARKAAGRKVSKTKRVNSSKAKGGKQGSTSSFRKQLECRTAELAEARAQQAATSELLKVIGHSKFDLKELFESLAENGVRLCHAERSFIFRFDGEYLRVVATHNASAEIIAFVEQNPIVPGKTSATARAAFYRRTVHVLDAQTDPEHTYRGRQVDPFRTILAVPILKADELLGVILIYRHEVRAFTDAEIALLETFANQAVVAIENVRLFDQVKARTEDLRESLQQQTATADVLKVISRSTFDLQKVLDTLTESATRLCEADHSAVFQCDGDFMRFKSSFGHRTEIHEHFRELFRTREMRIDRGSVTGRSALEARVVHVPDVLADPEFTRSDAQKIGGFRTALGAPLLRDGKVVGVIFVARNRPEPFSEKQIELVTTFADQAVIAIENVRLFDETQEALERQTATSEVLEVINSSPGNLAPVFDAMLEKAIRLCDAVSGHFRTYDGVSFPLAAVRGEADHLAAMRQSGPLVPGPHHPVSRILRGENLIHMPNTKESEEYRSDPRFRSLVDRGVRSLLTVALRKDSLLLGYINVYRHVAEPFTDRQVALLQNFAAQAVVAMENARLITETRQALERQTATADILKAIASSPNDVQPVFEAIAERSNRIVDGLSTSVLSVVGDKLYLKAFTPVNPEADATLKAFYPQPLSAFPFFDNVGKGQLGAITDSEADLVTQPSALELSRLRGWRSALLVPLLRHDKAIGAISVTRAEPGTFIDYHVQLLQTFADQAVIAIENARLFNETKEALERQTATADVLKVIASSPDDVQPVFQIIAERSNELVNGLSTSVLRLEEDMLRLMAYTKISPEADAALKAFYPKSLSALRWGESVREGKVFITTDVENDETLAEARQVARLRGWRSVLLVPLLSDQAPIGAISVTRREPGTFAENHVQLLKTFADQAVIAISNVGLFNEVQQRTRELSQSLDDLRAAQDRLIQTEKLASLGQLTAGIAHEIKNPLNFVNNFSALSAELTDELNDLLKDAALTDKMRTEVEELTRLLHDNLEKVVQHGKRADSIVKNMLLHSREGSGEQRSTDINTLVDDSLNLAYHGARAEKSGFNITLQRDFDASAGSAELFPQEITRALLNLISNGFYAATKRGSDGEAGFEPTLLAATKSLGNSVEIRIRDNGTGIPSEIKERIFNPFFTTKPAGEGTGLGLSMSHDIIVKQHGGTIRVNTELGAFTEFIVTLPRAISVQSPQRSTN